MTNEEAIEILQEERDWAQQLSYVNKALEKAMDALEKQPEWISVEDRLPDNYEWFLCWYEYYRFGDYNRMFQTYGLGYYVGNGRWGGDVSTGHKTKVLYWMPLPKKPRGSEEE